MISDKGQIAVYDAILFFVIISIASTIIFAQSSNIIGGGDDIEKERMIEYTHNARDVLLKSTIESTGYVDSDGYKTNLTDSTIHNLIIEYFYLLKSGLEKENLSGMENSINATLGNLIEEKYHYLFYCTYVDDVSKIVLSLSSGNHAIENLPLERYSSNWKSSVSVLPGNIDITLFIWK